MSIVYVIGTQAQIEDLHKKTRALYITAFQTRYPNAKTRMQLDYKDRITHVVEDTIIQLSTDGKDHADRFDNYVENSNYPTTDKCLLSYDDTIVDDNLEAGYYYNLTARTKNGADVALYDNTKAESEAQGFFAERL